MSRTLLSSLPLPVFSQSLSACTSEHQIGTKPNFPTFQPHIPAFAPREIQLQTVDHSCRDTQILKVSTLHQHQARAQQSSNPVPTPLINAAAVMTTEHVEQKQSIIVYECIRYASICTACSRLWVQEPCAWRAFANSSSKEFLGTTTWQKWYCVSVNMGYVRRSSKDSLQTRLKKWP